MNIAVFGTGVMGEIHIRFLKSIPEIDDVIIYDIDNNQLEKVKKYFGITKVYNNHYDLLKKESVDGVIVATPPNYHKSLVLDIINAGINVLVEKPIAHTIEDAEEMIKTANKKDIIFTVGHVERFNPVISKIKSFINNNTLKNIYLINTHRIGPFPKRLLGKFEGVLIDLAIHDFDLINYLSNGQIDEIKSQVIKGHGQEIYVKTLMDLNNEIKASCEFSWITPRRKRTIEIYGDSGMFRGDLFRQELWFFENSDFEKDHSFSNDFLQEGLVSDGKVVQYPIYKQEPILLELTNFIQSIKGSESILVNPLEALNALKNVLAISNK